MTAAARTGPMIDARRADSATKRARVLAVIEQMAERAEPISFAAVARRAGVSTWLVYTPDLRQAIEKARAGQTNRDRPGPTPRADTPAAVTDLVLARAEIARLRAEQATQQHQIQLALGVRLDDIAKADLVARVDELTRHNTALAADLARSNTETAALKAQIVGLEDDLAAARTSLRQVIRSNNLARHPDP